MLASARSDPRKHKANQRLWILESIALSVRTRIHRTLNRHEWQIDICSGTPDNCIDHRRIYGTNNNNWGQILQALFTETNNAYESPALVDISGSSPAMVGINTSGSAMATMFTSNGTTKDYYAWVELGTGGGTAARSDSALFTPQSPSSTPKITPSWTNGGSQVTMTATCSYASSISPTEVGLFLHTMNASNSMDDFLLDHTTFSALASNTAFTVTYSIALG
jgi:hypothetical protein